MLTKSQGKKLLKLARKAIESYLYVKELKYAKEQKEFKEKQGVFVTIYKAGKLRGCIGFPYPTMPLAEAIVEAARAAAFSDRRFEPVEREEFSKIKIEISILTVPKEIFVKGLAMTKEIKIGEDGLIIQHSGFSGLLLPQVAKEMKWNASEFLQGTCTKARLPADYWLKPECHVFKFQAQIFKEKAKEKKIIKKTKKKKPKKKKKIN